MRKASSALEVAQIAQQKGIKSLEQQKLENGLLSPDIQTFKSNFNKTPSSLINERIIIEAKRELYLTGKTVKEIAWEIGYED